ncbi:hypothetical protein EsH8_I_000429 [Colletotrichum jinshuiense]
MPRKARPTTPSMMLGPLGGPNSPPQSPTSNTPMIKGKYAARHLPPYHNFSRPVLLDGSGIQPTGNGHEFSFTPSNRFSQLSPRTSSEDSDSDEEEDSETESESEESEVPQAKAEEDDEEDEDSDDEEEDSDDEEESEDEDDDVPMNFHPPPLAPAPAPVPAAMPAPFSAPMPAAMFAPRPAPMPSSRMAVDSSSEEESGDEEGDEDDEDDSDLDSDSESEVALPAAPEIPQESRATNTKANFTLEELSDFDPMDQDRTGTIAPSGFSSPASARSRSRAPAPTELPHGLTRDMGKLNCSASSSEESDEDLDAEAAAHREFVRNQRELKMLKRRSHGSSIGKRTISERSDSDHEDWTPLDPDDVGSSARRLRRRVGDRRSFIHLHFQDPPPPRIDELEEPESEVEGTFIYCDSGTLARELPYWSIEIMEYESPSP